MDVVITNKDLASSSDAQDVNDPPPSLSPPKKQAHCSLLPHHYREIFHSILTKSSGQENISHLHHEFGKLTLSEQISQFLVATAQSQEAVVTKHNLILELVSHLRTILPSCQVHPFGSYFTQLSKDSSDLDLFVRTTDNNASIPGGIGKSEGEKVLEGVTQLLQSLQDFYCRVKPIRNAHVPIVRFTHKGSQIQCDLSFGSFSAVRNSELISFYMKLHPLVDIMLRFVRFWANFHELSGPFKVKNYCLNLLVLFYCGWRKIVPTLGEIQALEGVESDQEFNEIEGWETLVPCSTRRNFDLIQSTFQSSIQNLNDPVSFTAHVIRELTGFFGFYADMDFESNILATSTGEMVPKEEFASSSPKSIAAIKYQNCLVTRNIVSSKDKSQEQPFRTSVPLCVQDPFALIINVGAVTGKRLFKRFRVCCRETALSLSNVDKFDTSILDIFRPIKLPCEDNDDDDKVPAAKKPRYDKGKKNKGRNQKSNDSTESFEILNKPNSPVGLEESLGKIFTLTFQPGSPFVRQFAYSALQVWNITAERDNWRLLQKLKMLWVSFAMDFMTNFFTKYFKMETIMKCGDGWQMFPTASSSSFAAGDPMKYPLVIFREVEHAQILPQNIVNVPIHVREKIFIKLDALDEIKAETRSRVYNVKTNQANLFSTPGRDAVRKEMTNLSRNPVQAEEEISNAIIDASPPPPEDENVEVKIYVKLDSTMGDELPTMHLVFQGNDAKKDGYISALASLVSKSVPEYVIYRLRDWLETEATN